MIIEEMRVGKGREEKGREEREGGKKGKIEKGEGREGKGGEERKTYVLVLCLGAEKPVCIVISFDVPGAVITPHSSQKSRKQAPEANMSWPGTCSSSMAKLRFRPILQVSFIPCALGTFQQKV